ncbi:MAG: DNA recombination protein RmuC [Patescibacteria group bacterium]
MIALYITVGIIIGLVLAIMVIPGIRKMVFGSNEESFSIIEQKLNEYFPKALQSATEQLITMADQKLDAKKQTIDVDVANKKTAIEDLIKNIKEELTVSNKKLEDAEKERVGSFRELKSQLENQKMISEQLRVTTESLRKVLSNNQLRGQFGEQVAEDLLKMAGFVGGVDYFYNKAQEGSGTRPDFTVLLPDGVKINVDAKFPYSNLQKYVETEDKEAQKNHLKSFENDIKEKIKQVTTREYINPEDNTVDFVILFIPNEMIFSFIYEKMNDIWTEAMRQRVVFTGPFSFTATLRLIRQSYANFKIQNNVRKIVMLIKEFEKEFSKYNEEFTKIGDRINSLSDQYERVDTTRTKVLVRTVDRIRIEESEELPEIPEETETD